MFRGIFCLLAVLAIAGTAGADLLAYYDFTDAMGLPTTANEGTAGTAADGVLMNGATIVDINPDARGVKHVLKLDYGDGTVNQYMDIGKDWANWDPTGLEPFAIAAWIYVTPGTTGGWRTIMSKGWGASWDLSMGTPYGAGDDEIAFSAAPAVGGTSPITSSKLLYGSNCGVRDGYWHHIVGVVVGYGSTAAELYVDGKLQGTAPVWEGVDANDANVLIGADLIKLAEGYDYSWNGMLDNIAIYNNALTAQQVSDLYVGTFSCEQPVVPIPSSFEITGPAEVVEDSQAQYTATACVWQCHIHFPFCYDVNVTEEVIWWVEPETFASIDANGLLTIENLDTSEDVTVHAQYNYYYTESCAYTLEAEMAVDLCCTGDLNDDGKIDLGDYAILARWWLEAPGAPSADIAPFCSGDGIVDLNDLGLFVDQWSGIFNYGASIVYEISDCSMDLLAVEQSGQTRFSVTVEGRHIDFEDTMSANCCPDELELQMTVEDNLITIFEIEHVTMPCLCICDYPVTARLGPFEPGVYTLEVYEDWGGFIGSTIVVIEP